MGGAMQQPPASRLCPPYWPSKRGEHSAGPAPCADKSQQPGASMVPEQVGVSNAGSIDLCLDTSRILNTDAPRRAALVRKPDRSECAPKSVAFQPNLRGVCIHKVAHRFVGKPLKAELADRELGSQFETIRG